MATFILGYTLLQNVFPILKSRWLTSIARTGIPLIWDELSPGSNSGFFLICFPLFLFVLVRWSFSRLHFKLTSIQNPILENKSFLYLLSTEINCMNEIKF